MNREDRLREHQRSKGFKGTRYLFKRLWTCVIDRVHTLSFMNVRVTPGYIHFRLNIFRINMHRETPSLRRNTIHEQISFPTNVHTAAPKRLFLE